MNRPSRLALAVCVVLPLAGCKKEEEKPQQAPKQAARQQSPFDVYETTAHDIIAKDQPGDIVVNSAPVNLSPTASTADLVVTQSGATAPTISKIQFLGPAEVVETNTCQLQKEMPAGGACSIHLVYKPGQAPVQGQLLIVHSGPSSPILVPVHGEAAGTGAGGFNVDLAALRHQASEAAVEEAAAKPVFANDEAPAAEEPPEPVYPMAPMNKSNPHITATTPPRDMSRVVSRFQYITMTSQSEAFVEMDSEINATLDFPVYGGRNPVTGEVDPEPLLPAGTMVKTYCHPARNTNERGECYVTTMETPDNRTVDFKSLRALDSMGRPAVPGELNERYVERYGPGAFMSLLSAATILASPDQSQSTVGLGTQTQTESASRQAANQLAGDIHALAGKISDELAAKSARLSIPKATVMTVQLADDLYIPRPGEVIQERDPSKPADKVDRPKRAWDSITTGEVPRAAPGGQGGQAQATPAQQAALQYAQLQAQATAAAQRAAAQQDKQQ